ncbi:MAG: ATP synthase F1 subunit delta [Planctomycetota bacterium]
MPLTESSSEARPDALANVYAQSLLELAEAQGDGAGSQARIEAVLGQLEDVLELARNDARFSEFLASRVLADDARERSIKAIFAGKADDLVTNFLLVLNRKGRLAHLPSIVAAYDRLVQARFGRVEVDVFTASPIDVAELSPIRERLGSILGKDVVLHPYVDANMIGGVKFRVGDQLIDASVATRLRRMRDMLVEDGGAEIKAAASKLLDGNLDGN